LGKTRLLETSVPLLNFMDALQTLLKTRLPTFDFRKRFFCTFAFSNKNRIMTAQYQKTASQITDLMQQNFIKKRCFCVLKT
jgi:hypothetical protein